MSQTSECLERYNMPEQRPARGVRLCQSLESSHTILKTLGNTANLHVLRGAVAIQ